ncbi:TadE/TadG family type IV pilus assembly protein [Azospirillum sp. Marseille-Q6669]
MMETQAPESRRRPLPHDRRGVAALEMALLAPVLLLLVTATVDVVRYVSITLTLNRTAANVSDIATQFDKLRAGMTVVKGNEVGVLFLAATEVAQPLDLMAGGQVIVTSVANMGQGSRVMWQERAGTGSAISHYGAAGGAATLPPGFTQQPGDNAIFTELFYRFTPYLLSGPWLGDAGTSTTLYASAVYQPRLGTLTTLETGP